MDDEPRISVLMGVYNEEDFLHQAVESILSQTFDNFEYIIIDDASTDDSASIIESYDDDRLVLLRNETNRGLTESLNRGLERARGEYIARQDADDVSAPERFDKQISFFNRNNDVAVVGTGVHLIDGQGEVTDQRRGYCNPSFEDFLQKSHFVHGSIMARRSALEDVGGYDEFFRYGQDYELWLRLAQQYRLANIPAPLYQLRLHDESVYFSEKDESALYTVLAREIATGRTDRELLERLDGIEDYYDHLDDDQRRQFHLDLAVRYLRYGHTTPAITECRKARKYGHTVRSVVLEGLAHAGPTAIRGVRSSMRRYLNLKTRLSNRLDCPYQLPER